MVCKYIESLPSASHIIDLKITQIERLWQTTFDDGPSCEEEMAETSPFPILLGCKVVVVVVYYASWWVFSLSLAEMNMELRRAKDMDSTLWECAHGENFASRPMRLAPSLPLRLIYRSCGRLGRPSFPTMDLVDAWDQWDSQWSKSLIGSQLFSLPGDISLACSIFLVCAN